MTRRRQSSCSAELRSHDTSRATMKFAHELLALEAGCPEEFSGRFIKYKQLKKLIKRIREVEAAGGPDSPEEQQFLNLLNAEVAAVNRCASAWFCDIAKSLPE